MINLYQVVQSIIVYEKILPKNSINKSLLAAILKVMFFAL